ncbi:MAG: type II secretion system F family protein, partial [Planctomycetota bacterium]
GVAALVLPAFDALGFQDRLWANALRLSPTGAIAAAIIVPTALFIAALLWWRSSNLAGAAERRTSWIRWIPGAGRSARLCGQAALADMLQAMIDAGVPLPDALSLAGDASGQRRLRDVSHRLAESVRTGNELADQRDDLRGLPPLVRMALLAHRAPDAIAASLRRAAEVYRHQARSWALQVATFAPLVMTGLIGGLMVALSIAVLIQPYFATLEELTRGTVNPLR